MKKLLAGVLLFFAVSTVHAASIYDLDVNDGVYLEGILSDELVYVVRIDYGSHRVKVRRSSDGTTAWVSPSKLVSREESIGRDIGRGVVAAALIVCAFDPDSCSNTSSGSRQDLTQQTSRTPTGYKFYVKNDCSHSVKLALRYKKLDGAWTTKGWWTFGANSGRYLAFTDGRYAVSNNAIAYYYAEAKDRSLLWQGDHTHRLDGSDLPMRKIRDDNGDTELRLTCNV